MKKLSFLFATLVLLMSYHPVQAQAKTGEAYFLGKWKVSIPATPLGDLKRIYSIEKTAAGLTGNVTDAETGAEVAKLSKVEINGDKMTLYYSAHDLDVIFVLTKKDEDHVTGIIMDQYNATGERVNGK